MVDRLPYVKNTKTDEDGRVLHMPEWYMDEMKAFKNFWDDERYAVGDKWLGGDDDYVFHGGSVYHTRLTLRLKHDER